MGSVQANLVWRCFVVERFKSQWCSKTYTISFLFHAGEIKIQPTLTFGCKICNQNSVNKPIIFSSESAHIEIVWGGASAWQRRRKRTVLVRDAITVAAPSASPAAYASSSRRAPPDHREPTTRLPAAAVAEPEARRQRTRPTGHRLTRRRPALRAGINDSFNAAVRLWWPTKFPFTISDSQSRQSDPHRIMLKKHQIISNNLTNKQQIISNNLKKSIQIINQIISNWLQIILK